jgi:hypothetical protein
MRHIKLLQLSQEVKIHELFKSPRMCVEDIKVEISIEGQCLWKIFFFTNALYLGKH